MQQSDVFIRYLFLSYKLSKASFHCPLVYIFRRNNFEKRPHIANSSICRSYSNINKVDTVTSSPLFPFVKAFHRLPYTCLCNVSPQKDGERPTSRRICNFLLVRDRRHLEGEKRPPFPAITFSCQDSYFRCAMRITHGLFLRISGRPLVFLFNKRIVM